jgi:hypothetical protein
MKTLKVMMLSAVLLTAGLLVGCNCTTPKNTAEVKAEENVKLCKKCGQVAGSKECCRPDQPKCEKCGLDKDSPGCCKM